MAGNRRHVAEDLGVDEGGSRNKVYTTLKKLTGMNFPESESLSVVSDCCNSMGIVHGIL